MADITLRFPDEESAERFEGWMCDGGGEVAFFDSEGNTMYGAELAKHRINHAAYPEKGLVVFSKTPTEK